MLSYNQSLFNYLDLSIIGVFLFSIGMGFYRGLIWELLKYIAFAVSIFITIFVLFKLFPMFESYNIEQAFWYLLIMGGAVFLTCVVIMLYFVQKLSKIIRKTYFAWSDKLLGAIFGGIRASIFVLLLYSGLMIITLNKKPDWMQQSLLSVPLDKGSEMVQNLIYKLGNEKIIKLLKMDLLRMDVLNMDLLKSDSIKKASKIVNALK